MSEDSDKYGYEDDLKRLDPRIGENPFSVPDGYFDQLGDNIRFRATFESSIDKTGEFSVPEGYFENLSDRIQGRLSEIGLKSRVTEPGFTTPDGYFDRLTDRILSGVLSGKEEKSITVEARPEKSRPETPIRKLFRPSWVRYATAACALIVSSYLIKNNLMVSQGYDLSSIPDEELVDYLRLYGDTRDMLLFSEYSAEWDYNELSPEIGKDEIQWYLDNTW